MHTILIGTPQSDKQPAGHAAFFAVACILSNVFVAWGIKENKLLPPLIPVST
jgi:hypothetical protein